MARLSYLLLSSLAVLGANAASAVIDLTPDNFDSIVLKSGKPALVEFFAPWCGHCKTLAPVYEELAQNFESVKDKVTIAKVDADDHKELGRRFGVQGFPTLKWFDGKSDTPSDYSSGRDLDSLSAFVTDKTGVKPKTKKGVPSEVVMLTDSSFKQEIGKDKDVLVAFTAPWCGHCKTLAPTWETLARDFASEPTVLIAKVDAEAPNARAIAEEQGIKSYPTIKYFPKGSTTPEAYNGGRTEKDLVSFMNEKAGTHRAVGGGLDSTAGLIPELDELVKQYLVKPDPEILKRGYKAMKEMGKDVYVEYYGKVAQKLHANADYVEKELKRLEGLLSKGSLAPAKLDDLTKRSNILRQFRSTDAGKEEL
ncbi:hypothetical protein W97_09142 [Coniosporium apollinis CBS 100218]|uniref:protein disulfide-isomerase n=1 Tax=Coniosporium apollinis (strain CBS 100218) TaxID=1168221 RepID=R7Z6Z1_CONA1|nr:uncharacterized protein W97_09142 [Coniosporium apollinis CBS 100218]EON69878.1 hypothetical protein W97_09142 [Coniosporium apollinis CBS 100218]